MSADLPHPPPPAEGGGAHPVSDLLVDAANGRFPTPDGGWHRVQPWREDVEAVLSFTGHAVLAVGQDLPDDVLQGWELDGFGAAHHPRVLQSLVGPHGWVDCLDNVVVAHGRGLPGDGLDDRLDDRFGERLGERSGGASGGPALVRCKDLGDHPRVRLATSLRDDVMVWADVGRTGLITLGRGLGGLLELSVEVVSPGRGLGRALMSAALELVPRDEVVVACVAPGNAASLRALLATGFAPVCSVQVYRPDRR